jgi:hypothetical protein
LLDTLLTVIMSYSLSTERLSGPQNGFIVILTETSPNSLVKIASFGCTANTSSKDTEIMPLCQYIVSEEKLPLSVTSEPHSMLEGQLNFSQVMVTHYDIQPYCVSAAVTRQPSRSRNHKVKDISI